MYRSRHLVKPLVRIAALVVLPQVVFLILMACFFPPQGFWAWFFLVAAECSVWIGFLSGIAQLTGSSLSQWVGWDIFRVLSAFEKTTNRTLSSIRDTLPVLNRRLERSEVSGIWEHLEQGHPVLIEGESGSGKSGIAAEVVRQAEHRGIPTLFLNARNYSSIVSNFGDLEQYVGVSMPLRDCLEKLANHMGRCLLVVDQLDNVVGTPAGQVSTEILAVAKTLRNVIIMAVGGVVGSTENQAIRDLEFKVIQSHPLDRQRVVELLKEMTVTHPSDALLTLSTNIFYLSLVAELARDMDVSLVEGKVLLLDKYKKALERAEGAEVIQAAIDLAYDKLATGATDFALPRIQSPAMRKLQNRGVIIPAGYGLFRFRHEQLQYYFFASGAVDRGESPASILERLAGHRARSALVWVLRIYYQRQSNESAEYLQEALIKSNRLDFLEQAALLDEIHTWVDLTVHPDVVEVVLDMLQTKQDLRAYFFRAGPRAEWAPILWTHGFFESPPLPEKTEQGYVLRQWDVQYYLLSVAPQVPDIVIKHVETIDGLGWYISQAIRAANSLPSHESERVVPRVVAWLHDPNIAAVIYQEAIELMEKLAKDGRIDSALSLFGALTNILLNSKLIFDRVLGTSLQPAVGFELIKRASPQTVIAILEDHLLNSLKQRAETQKKPELEFSSWWRDAIEDTGQDFAITYEDWILSSLRDTVESWVKAAPDSVEGLVTRYLDDPHRILRRLGFHILHRYPRAFQPHISRELLRRANLDEKEIHHEYFMLLRQGFPYLTLYEQQSLVSMILDGPNHEQTTRLAEWVQKERGVPTETCIPMHRKSWICDRLWMIRAYLDDDARQRLADLVAEGGAPEHPEFLAWSSGVHEITDVSPFAEHDLSKMTPGALLDLSKRWQPDPKDRFESERASYVGFANALANVVCAEPEKYTDYLADISMQRPEYADAILV